MPRRYSFSHNDFAILKVSSRTFTINDQRQPTPTVDNPSKWLPRTPRKTQRRVRFLSNQCNISQHVLRPFPPPWVAMIEVFEHRLLNCEIEMRQTVGKRCAQQQQILRVLQERLLMRKLNRRCHQGRKASQCCCKGCLEGSKLISIRPRNNHC